MGQGQGHSARCPRCCSDQEAHVLLDRNDQAAEHLTPNPGDIDLRGTVIQFGCSQYFCSEELGEVKIDIFRMGNRDLHSCCFFETEDGSAKAGQKYLPLSGRVDFAPGESEKSITIPIMQDDKWDSTLEFYVRITEVVNATRGKYLSFCRVSIIDDDVFPTNRFREGMMKQAIPDLKDVPVSQLMTEYVKMNLQHNDVKAGVIRWMICDAIKGAYFCMTLWLNLYLVDEVILGGRREEEGEEPEAVEGRLLLSGIRYGARMLRETMSSPENSGDLGVEELQHRKEMAIVLGVLYVVPFLLMLWLELYKESLGIPELSRKSLQGNLFRKYLNYKESIRESFSAGEIAMAMARDIPEVVEKGFMKWLQIVRISQKLIYSLLFILAENKRAAVPLICFPGIMVVFLFVRERVVMEATEDVASRQNHLIHCINDSIRNIRLIADFHLRPHTVQNIEHCIDGCNQKLQAYRLLLRKNVYLVPSLTTIIVGLWMVFGTMEVHQLGGPLSLGTFMSTINVFKEIGHELQEVYIEFMEIQMTFGPLQKVTYFMNLPTINMEQMQVYEARRERGADLRKSKQAELQASKTPGGVFQEAVQAASQEPTFAIDKVDIELCKVNHAFDDVPVPSGPLACSNINQKFLQGKFYAICGSRHQGKATMLKLLGQVLVPSGNGFIFIPPHLRVAHIDRATCILDHTLYRNIVLNLGEQEADKREDEILAKRVLGVCTRCKFSSRLMERMKLEQRQEKELRERRLASGNRNLSVKSLFLKTTDDMAEQDVDRSKKWVSWLTHSDRARLNMARALVLNPEMLVMHVPTQAFEEQEAQDLLGLLKTHVREKGLELEPGEKPFRRPRTLFMSSTSRTACLSFADHIFVLQDGQLIEQDATELH